jgi:hypothetical protein
VNRGLNTLKRNQKDSLAVVIKPEDYIIVRYIIMMDEYGFDEVAVLEQLKDEFPKWTMHMLKCTVSPYRALAQQWFEKGRTMVHGLVLGWIQANK